MTQMTKLLDFYELKDSACYAMTSDGAALTYGTKVDVPGVMTLAITSGEVASVRLKGDNKIRRVDTRELSKKIKVQHSAANFDLFALLTGGTAATTGATPNTTSSFTQKGNDRYGMFKLAGLINNARDAGSPNGANGVLNFYKCVVTSPPQFTVGPEGTIWEWECEAFPTDFDDKLWDITAYETAATLT